MIELKRWGLYAVVVVGYALVAAGALVAIRQQAEPPAQVHEQLVFVHGLLTAWSWVPYLLLVLGLPSLVAGSRPSGINQPTWMRAERWHYCFLILLAAPAIYLWRPGSLELLPPEQALELHLILSSDPLRDLLLHLPMVLSVLATATVLCTMAVSGPEHQGHSLVEVTIGVVALGCGLTLVALASRYDGSWAWVASVLLSLPASFLVLGVQRKGRSKSPGFLFLLAIVAEYLGLVEGQSLGYPVPQFLYTFLPWIVALLGVLVLPMAGRILQRRAKARVVARAAVLTILDGLETAIRFIFLPVGLYSGAAIGLALLADGAEQYLVTGQQLYLVRACAGFTLFAAAMIFCRALLLGCPLVQSIVPYLVRLAELTPSLMWLVWALILAGPSLGVTYFRPSIITWAGTIALAAVILYMLARGILPSAGRSPRPARGESSSSVPKSDSSPVPT